MKTVKITLGSGKKVRLSVKKRIKYSDLSVIATAIRNDVFDGDGYFPYMKQLGLVHYILLYYANCSLEDADEMMELYASGQLGPVFKAIDAKQLAELYAMVDDILEYTRSRSGMDSLCAMILQEVRAHKVGAPEHADTEVNS